MDCYSYFRSTASHRVRIALNLKQVPHTMHGVDLLADGGAQHEVEFRSVNPQGYVPAIIDGEFALSQSLAILEYLDERYPDPPLLPASLEGRARARQFAQIISSDIHPLNNLRVMQYLQTEFGMPEPGRRRWYHHWILEGFDALELWLTAESSSGPYCLGDCVSLADICLVPQLHSARRMRVPLEDFPALVDIEAACMELDAFQRAAPEAQADAPATS
ncbi:MAG: maleylacetoacetate isomerase [Gammaproteobacteria bacterium]|nr:maleylacetoacetate isomerase [Gammaproteobacteria bacterium]